MSQPSLLIPRRSAHVTSKCSSHRVISSSLSAGLAGCRAWLCGCGVGWGGGLGVWQLPPGVNSPVGRTD
eukprot:11625254-Prorocentrum_lima.AAC.1